MRRVPAAVPLAALAAGFLLTAAPALAKDPPAPPLPEMAAATAGDVASQLAVAEAYYAGKEVKQSYKEARAWYEKAAAQKDPVALRRLGEMYAKGEGGKKSKKKAVEQWIAAEKAGDTESVILVADAYYKDITGEDTPKPGRFGFQGGSVPVNRIDDALAWYEAALERDPRPEVKARAKMGVYVLTTLKSASNVQATTQ